MLQCMQVHTYTRWAKTDHYERL